MKTNAADFAFAANLNIAGRPAAFHSCTYQASYILLLCWRTELSLYNYNIYYRPGKENIVADTFSQASRAVLTQKHYTRIIVPCIIL